MKAANIMTQPVITATPESSVADAAQLMLQHRISGVPVVDGAGVVVGIITEGDLLRRTETGTALRYPPWRGPVIGAGRLARDYVNANARTIGEIMTRNVASVPSEADLTDVVRLMETLRVKRFPIIDDGRLVGIVSRADFLRPLATNSAARANRYEGNIADSEICSRVLAEIATQEWAPQTAIDAVVKDGVVELSGTIADERQRAALMVLTGKTRGVRTVLCRVTSTGQTQEPGAREETGDQLIERLF
jgi:CBS domain-containing protein